MPTGGTPEDRVLRWVAGTAGATSKGVPLQVLVRQLKGDLTGLDFARLQQACQNLEAAGLVTRDWFGPADFVMRPTEAGSARANELEKLIGHRRAVSTTSAPRPAPAPSPVVVAPQPAPAAPEVRARPSPPVMPDLGRSPGARPEANLPIRILLYSYLYTIGAGTNVPVAKPEIAHYLDGQGVILPEGQLDRMALEMQGRGFLHVSITGPNDFEVILTAKGMALAEGLLDGRVRSATHVPTLVEAAAAASADAPPDERPEARPFQVSGPSPIPSGSAGTPPGTPEGTDPVQDAWVAAENEIVRLQAEVERLQGELARVSAGPAAPPATPGDSGELSRLQEELAQALEDKRLDRETLNEVLNQLEQLTRRVQEQEQEIAMLRGTAPGG